MVAFSTSSSSSTVGGTTYSDTTLIFDFSGDNLCNGMAMRNHLYAMYPVNQADDIQGDDIEAVLFEYKQKNAGAGFSAEGQDLLSLLVAKASPPLAYDFTSASPIASVTTSYSYSIDTTTGAISESYTISRVYYRVIGGALMVAGAMVPYFCVSLPASFKSVFSSIGLSEPSHAVFAIDTSPLSPPMRGISLYQLVDYNDAPFANHLVYSSCNDGKVIGEPGAVGQARLVTDRSRNFFASGVNGGGVSVSRTTSATWDLVAIYNGPSSPPSGTVDCYWSDTQSLIHTDNFAISWSGPSTVPIAGGAYTYYVYTASGSTSFANFTGASLVSLGYTINNNGWIFETGKTVENVRRPFSIVPASGPDGSWVPAIFYKI